MWEIRGRRLEMLPCAGYAGVGRNPPRHAHRAGILAVPGHQGLPGSRAGALSLI